MDTEENLNSLIVEDKKMNHPIEESKRTSRTTSSISPLKYLMKGNSIIGATIDIPLGLIHNKDFPFSDNALLRVEIAENRIVLSEPTMWWETVDTCSLPWCRRYERLPEQVKKILEHIRETKKTIDVIKLVKEVTKENTQ